ncbi:MAG TPA: hypothetical protein VM260_07960 [Pirellula sp.]|nr:hypothetical protein [Pirellula sp.]
MSISSATQHTINILAKAEQTRSDIATAVLSKQLSAEKQKGQAMVKLIEQSTVKSTRGIDVKA